MHPGWARGCGAHRIEETASELRVRRLRVYPEECYLRPSSFANRSYASGLIHLQSTQNVYLVWLMLCNMT